MSHLKNIAIAGASGNAGRHIIEALLASGNFNVTAVTRGQSSSTFPTAVKVHRGDYESLDFTVPVLQGQDVLIIVLAGMAPKDIQSRLIEAADQASVPWILPCEYGPDTANPTIAESLPVFQSKKRYRDEIEALGKSNWIAVITGLWFDSVRDSPYSTLCIRLTRT